MKTVSCPPAVHPSWCTSDYIIVHSRAPLAWAQELRTKKTNPSVGRVSSGLEVGTLAKKDYLDVKSRSKEASISLKLFSGLLRFPREDASLQQGRLATPGTE